MRLKKRYIFPFIILIILILPIPPLHAGKMLILDDRVEKLNLGPYLEYLVDEKGTYTINDVSEGKLSEQFKQNEKKNLNFGFNRSDRYRTAFWVRFTLKNASGKRSEWLVEHPYDNIDHVFFYTPERSSGYTVKKAGQTIPFNTREIKHRYHIFKAALNKNETKTFYMRFHNDTNMSIPLSLYSADAFYTHDHNMQMGLGIYYGSMLVMLFFNLILFFFLWDRNYLYLVLFISAWILTQMDVNGVSYEYLWPDAPWWNQRAEFFWTGFVDFTAIVFALSFLTIKEKFPRLYRAVLFLLVIITGQIIAAVIPTYDLSPGIHVIKLKIHNVIILVSVLTGIFLGIISLIRGYKPARLYLVAWLSFLVGVIMYISSITLGVLPQNFITTNSMQIGSALIVVLLSIALADRYRLIQFEKEIAERTNLRQTEFFINLSHEIKTPLTLISNFMEQYIDEHGSSEELSIIKQNIDKLSQDMINFFDVLKFERGLDFYDHEHIVDLSDILKQKIELFKSLAYRSGIDIRTDIEKEVYVKADPLAVERIINNLMDNAVRYNRRAGSINVSLESGHDDITLTVQDTGIGMEAEQLKNIFVPYFQITHQKRNIQGIGMGLSLVKKIVDTLGGVIDVESEPGKGSTFTVTLKRYELGEGDTVTREFLSVKPADTLQYLSKFKDTPPEGKQGHTVLIVEDNRDLVKLLRDRLGARYNVHTALDGREALKMLTDMPTPDVIVSDIMMDEMDGYRFFDAVTEQDEYRDIPFIFVTAKSQVDDKIEGLRRGAIDYICKPFVVQELISKIDSILKYQDLKKALFEKDKFTSLGMLLGGISHEIFNPLSGITGPMDNLKKLISETELIESETVSGYFRNMQESIDKIEGIINNIRVLYSSKPLEIETVDMSGIIGEVIGNYEREKGNRIEFLSRIDKNTEVRGNRDAIYQIINNLVSNAVDSIAEEGKVSILVENHGNGNTLMVTDTGCGIPESKRDMIFNAFYTTKDPGSGIGLGLNIVKNLVLKLNWEIAVESTPGAGTIFTVIMKG